MHQIFFFLFQITLYRCRLCAFSDFHFFMVSDIGELTEYLNAMLKDFQVYDYSLSLRLSGRMLNNYSYKKC